MRQRPVRPRRLRQPPAPIVALTMPTTNKVSRARRAIKANINTLDGEVISILLLLVDGARRAIIRSKVMASSSVGSSESLSFKDKTCF